jgi:hypothetical protein
MLKRMVRLSSDCLILKAGGTMAPLKAGKYSPKDTVSHSRRYKSSILNLHDVGKINTSIFFQHTELQWGTGQV